MTVTRKLFKLHLEFARTIVERVDDGNLLSFYRYIDILEKHLDGWYGAGELHQPRRKLAASIDEHNRTHNDLLKILPRAGKTTLRDYVGAIETAEQMGYTELATDARKKGKALYDDEVWRL